MPIIPSKEEIKLMEAQHYANQLKIEELKKQGLDVEYLQKLKKSQDEKKIFDDETVDSKPKVFDNEYYAKSFEDFRVKLLLH